MDAAAPAGDEVWTVGESAAYLNAGGVDLRISAKKVRFMVKDPECQIRAVSGGQPAAGKRTWYRVLASTVRAERARLLALAGREDPDWPVREGAG